MKKELLNHALFFGDRGAGNAANLFIFDLREFLLTVDPAIIMDGARKVWAQIEDTEVEVLYTKGIGGLPWAVYLRNAAAEKGRQLNILFVRDERKNRNRRKRIEGLDPANIRLDAPAFFVDDLINGGWTQRGALATLEEEGYKLKHLGVACIVDLWFQSRTHEAQGYKIARLFRRHDLGLTRTDPPKGLLKQTPVWQTFRHHRFNVMPIKVPPMIHFGRLFAPNDANELHCLDPDTGELHWIIQSPNPQPKGSCCRVQADESHVYWTSYDGTLCKIEPISGDVVYRVYLDQAVHSTPVLLGDGRLVVATERDKDRIGQHWYGLGDIVCVDTETGATLWRTPTDGMMPGSPCYHKELGVVAVGSNDFFIYVLDVADGRIVHKLPTRGEVKGTSAIHGNTLISLALWGWCQAFDLVSGKLLWERKIGAETMHSEPLVIGDKVYVNNKGEDGLIFCLDVATGRIEWLCRIRGQVGWGVKQRNAKELLASCHGGYVVTIDKDTGEKLRYSRLSESSPNLKFPNLYTPPVFWNNRVIWTTNDKGIACFEFGDDNEA